MLEFLSTGLALTNKYAPIAYTTIGRNREGLARICDHNPKELLEVKRHIKSDLMESIVCKKIYSWIDSLGTLPEQTDLNKRVTLEFTNELVRLGFRDKIPLIIEIYKNKFNKQ